MYTPSQVTRQYDAYMTFQLRKSTSAIIKFTIDKSLRFQVNWLYFARDTSIKWRPKNSSLNLNFHSFRKSDPNIFIQDPFKTST